LSAYTQIQKTGFKRNPLPVRIWIILAESSGGGQRLKREKYFLRKEVKRDEEVAKKF
jgi:hypothetical protein